MTRPRLLPAPAGPHPIRVVLADAEAPAQGGISDDLRLFLTAWAGGLVFFGTFIG